MQSTNCFFLHDVDYVAVSSSPKKLGEGANEFYVVDISVILKDGTHKDIYLLSETPEKLKIHNVKEPGCKAIDHLVNMHLTIMGPPNETNKR